MSFWKLSIFAGAVCTLLAANPALAGPPYATDDPEPTDYRHFEIYLFSDATKIASGTEGTLPGLEINYGALPDVQISADIPLNFDKGDGRGFQFGYGAMSFGLKYRFVHEDENGWRPQIAFFPAVEIPIGDSDREVGGGHMREYLPVWAQKSFGAWTTFGGGGYWINPGRGNRNYWFMGWAVTRQVTDRLSLGAEIFRQTPDTSDAAHSSGIGVGAEYDFSNQWHFVGSINTGIQHRETTNKFSYYVALKWTP